MSNKIDFDPNNLSTKDRSRLIDRRPPGKTIIEMAAMSGPTSLAFAVRFAMDHYTYKRSKSGGVKQATVSDVLYAVEAAVMTYVEEVIEGNDLSVPDDMDVIEENPEYDERRPISELGEGKSKNPYDFIVKGK